jgi:hypothetical protein
VDIHQARIDSNQREIMAKLDVHHERTNATNLEANAEEKEPDSEYQEVPKEVAALENLKHSRSYMRTGI